VRFNAGPFLSEALLYPDLPLGFQITQRDFPIAKRGALHVQRGDGTSFAVGIDQLQLEQDSGKSLHDAHPTHSLIDLNRAGAALMEIVTAPDMACVSVHNEASY